MADRSAKLRVMGPVCRCDVVAAAGHLLFTGPLRSMAGASGDGFLCSITACLRPSGQRPGTRVGCCQSTPAASFLPPWSASQRLEVRGERAFRQTAAATATTGVWPGAARTSKHKT